MGSYLNPGSRSFEMALASEIFVDKSLLIEKTNRMLGTLQRLSVSADHGGLENQWQLICWRLIMEVERILQLYLTV